MHTSIIKGQGIIGARIKFNSSELLAISLLKKSLSMAEPDNKLEVYTSVITDDLQAMINLLDRITIDISSLDEARKNLFSPVNKDKDDELASDKKHKEIASQVV